MNQNEGVIVILEAAAGSTISREHNMEYEYHCVGTSG